MTAKRKPSKEDFAKEFILTGCKNGTQAAINAGYSEKTAAQAASRLLKDVNVCALIDKYKKASTKKFIWTKEEKLLKLEEIVNNCIDKNDESKMHNPTAAIAALKEHNLMQGDNAPTQIDNTHTIKTFADMYGDS